MELNITITKTRSCEECGCYYPDPCLECGGSRAHSSWRERGGDEVRIVAAWTEAEYDVGIPEHLDVVSAVWEDDGAELALSELDASDHAAIKEAAHACIWGEDGGPGSYYAW